jgi:hypothetical protein
LDELVRIGRGKQCSERLRGLRFRKQESLCYIAIDIDQCFQIRMTLHSLRTGHGSKAMCESDNALTQRPLRWILRAIQYKAAIDLQFGRGKVAQLGK